VIPKIGFSLQAQYDCPMAEVIALLNNAGFSAVSPLWSEDLDMAALTRCVHAKGMTVQSLHAPRKSTAPMWQPESAEAVEVLALLKKSIDTCAKFHVPILVVHSWQGLHYTFPESLPDFRHFDALVEYAGQNGICIAFENLEGTEYLCALLTRYQDHPNVGFCWDCGHDSCYPPNTDLLHRFGNQLIMTHLHDNFGVRDPAGIFNGGDDLHFIPFDGSLDWDHVLTRLRSAAPQEILNFELKTRTKSKNEADLPYLHLSLEQFIERAAERALEIAEKYDEIMNQA